MPPWFESHARGEKTVPVFLEVDSNSGSRGAVFPETARFAKD